MVPRHFNEELSRSLEQFPVVSILGVRQCGKSTFVRAALPDWAYFDLENPFVADPLREDLQRRLRQLGDHVVFDEAQRLPELFPFLKALVDEDRQKKGRFVLLGSASPALIRQISESLAGRVGYMDMTPFQWDEVLPAVPQATLEDLWYRGGFPDLFLEQDAIRRQRWVEAYVRSLTERDLPALGIAFSAAQMRKLIGMLAHVSGGIWNASQFTASLGVDYKTVNRYADILEQTFLIRKLPPYFRNVGKRLVKSPKIFWRDTGLLHQLLGIRDPGALETHPNRGASWETFLVEQVASVYRLVFPGITAHYWRTARGEEVDLLMDRGDRLVPFEIKLHSAPKASDAPHLRACMNDLGIRKGYVLYPGEQDYSLAEGIDLLSASKWLADPRRFMDL